MTAQPSPIRPSGKPAARAAFAWDDPFLLDNQRADDERMIRDAARDFAAAKLQPRVIDA